jgi:NADH:ubiquinone oxidoreductase subunit F (NADH-binding)/(2Fe-2S) ferredoxin
MARYMRRLESFKDLQSVKDEFLDSVKDYRYTVIVCGGTGCVSSHCADVMTALKKQYSVRGLRDEVRIVESGCIGLCALGPTVVVEPDGVFYCNMTPEKIIQVVDKHLIGGNIVMDYTFLDENTGEHIPYMKDIPFFKDQVKIALRNCGTIDYDSIEEYISRGGYFAFKKAVETLGRQGVYEELKASGLRGRGGAGFPTGTKWESGYNAAGDQKYIVCNADEGDPGAFMDRSILEGDPHSIIEAMMLGGYTIGANKGYVYVRAEYPIAVERLSEAIETARAFGLLGENILGTGFSFDVEIRIGAGAFVCGEETALLNSIEGKRGEPRQKPPYPFQKGLFGCPTIINNVETLANVPAIILNGAEWYAAYGVGRSKGTKVFALAGDIRYSGIIEIPMGMHMGDIVYTIGGGLKEGRAFKAIQSGGPSGGCLTKDHLDVSVDYESLSAMGAIMGSGGLIVMDENTCMVDTARYFMDFVQDESCGHCVPCRIGTKRMLELLQKIVAGKGEAGDLDALEILANTVKDTAMCGLGQTAPNPVLTTLKYFREEYEAHVLHKTCPAHVCRDMMTYVIDPEKCRGCTLCARNCPMGAISGTVKEPHVIDKEKCSRCGTCISNCKFGAIAVQ